MCTTYYVGDQVTKLWIAIVIQLVTINRYCPVDVDDYNMLVLNMLHPVAKDDNLVSSATLEKVHVLIGKYAVGTVVSVTLTDKQHSEKDIVALRDVETGVKACVLM